MDHNGGTWICDECGTSIKQPSEGWLEWTVDPTYYPRPRVAQVRIVHHKTASPKLERSKGRSGCYLPHPAANPLRIRDHHLNVMLENDMARVWELFELYDFGTAEAVKLLRRLLYGDDT